MYAKTSIALLAGVTLAACSLNPTDYETTPVVVQSEAGPVTCQLYTLDQVTWDRSISRPNNMDVATADQLCRNEGTRLLPGNSNAEPVVSDDMDASL